MRFRCDGSYINSVTVSVFISGVTAEVEFSATQHRTYENPWLLPLALLYHAPGMYFYKNRDNLDERASDGVQIIINSKGGGFLVGPDGLNTDLFNCVPLKSLPDPK